MKRRNGSKKLRWESEKDLRISLVSFGEAKGKKEKKIIVGLTL